VFKFSGLTTSAIIASSRYVEMKCFFSPFQVSRVCLWSWSSYGENEAAAGVQRRRGSQPGRDGYTFWKREERKHVRVFFR